MNNAQYHLVFTIWVWITLCILYFQTVLDEKSYFFHRVFLPNQCYNIIWYTYLLAIRTISSLLSPETATFSRGYSQVCPSVFKLFTCFSFSPEQMDTVAINLTKSDIMWMEFKFLNMKDHSFYQGMGGGLFVDFFYW